MNEPILTQQQIKELAKPIVGMVSGICAYYQNPDNEKAFQDWYMRRYGHPAPEGV